MYENIIYAIVDLTTWNEGLSASGLPLSNFYEQILETAPETLRYSVCGDAFVIKTDNHSDAASLTSFAEAYSVGYTLYNHSGISQVMATSAWTMPEPPIE